MCGRLLQSKHTSNFRYDEFSVYNSIDMWVLNIANYALSLAVDISYGHTQIHRHIAAPYACREVFVLFVVCASLLCGVTEAEYTKADRHLTSIWFLFSNQISQKVGHQQIVVTFIVTECGFCGSNKYSDVLCSHNMRVWMSPVIQQWLCGMYPTLNALHVHDVMHVCIVCRIVEYTHIAHALIHFWFPIGI